MTERRRQVTGALIYALIGVVIVGVLIVLVRTWSLADSIRENQKTNTSTVELIRDCTEPTGKCFQRGQRRTASTVADINKITLFAAACADREGEQGLTQVQACVLRRLTLADRRPVG